MKKIVTVVCLILFSFGISSVAFATFVCPKNEKCAAIRYDDVNEDSWYHLYVDYCNGRWEAVLPISETEFGASMPVTRGECVYALYMIGEEDPMLYHAHDESWIDYEIPDVDFDSDIYDVCIWAMRCHIIFGYEDGSFRPDELITREQMAAIIHRFYLQTGRTDDIASIKKFVDHESVADWATRDMQFMVCKEYYQGNDKNELKPKANITKGEFCALLYRYFEPFKGDIIEEDPLPGPIW